MSGGGCAPLRLSWALLLIGACALVYANGVTGSFTYDDKAIIRDNPRLRSPERVVDIFTTQYFGGPKGTGTAYRPLLLLSFAIQWWIHGADPVQFHVVNVLLHAAATLLLAKLLLRLALSPPVAIGSALLFAVHPMHVEAVTSLVGRGETLAAGLVLGSLLAALRFADGGRRRFLVLAVSLVLFFAANLVKESAAVAPALLFLVLAFSAEGGLPARFRSALVRGGIFYAGAAAILGLVFGIRSEILGGALKGEHTGIFELENPLATLPAVERAINACAVFLRTLGRLAFPLRISSDESAWSIRLLGLESPVAWAAALLLAALTLAAVFRLAGREGERSVPALGFLWMAAAALPASNILFPTGTIFAERLAYLPSAGFCMIAAAWISGGRRASPEPAAWEGLSRGRLAAMAAAALLLSMRTIVRNPVWASDEALFTSMIRESPGSAKAHYDFAYMSAQIGQRQRALEHYIRATEIYPKYWDAWAGRGRMERELGNPMASLRAYEEALRISPDYENGFFGLGLAYEALDDPAAAERTYREGLRRHPRSLPLAYRLARLLDAGGRPEALYAWRRALAIEPRSAAAREGLREWELSERGRRAAEARRPSP